MVLHCQSGLIAFELISIVKVNLAHKQIELQAQSEIIQCITVCKYMYVYIDHIIMYFLQHAFLAKLNYI